MESQVAVDSLMFIPDVNPTKNSTVALTHLWCDGEGTLSQIVGTHAAAPLSIMISCNGCSCCGDGLTVEWTQSREGDFGLKGLAIAAACLPALPCTTCMCSRGQPACLFQLIWLRLLGLGVQVCMPMFFRPYTCMCACIWWGLFVSFHPFAWRKVKALGCCCLNASYMFRPVTSWVSPEDAAATRRDVIPLAFWTPLCCGGDGSALCAKSVR